jgi:hypothetical protein
MNPSNSNTADQDIMANTGSYSPYSPIFGNVEIQAIPQQSFGAVQPSFGVVGYMSVEQVSAALAMYAPQQSSTTINSTQNSSTTIQGTTSYQDKNGNIAMMMGYSASGAFG